MLRKMSAPVSSLAWQLHRVGGLKHCARYALRYHLRWRAHVRQPLNGNHACTQVEKALSTISFLHHEYLDRC